MMDLRRAQETAAAARRQEETRRHQEEWMWSANILFIGDVYNDEDVDNIDADDDTISGVYIIASPSILRFGQSKIDF